LGLPRGLAFKEGRRLANGTGEGTERLLARFPNARVNADEQRQFRAALHRPLLSLPKDVRNRVVDLIMATVTN
jgi:type I restriction enzyme R subunit